MKFARTILSGLAVMLLASGCLGVSLFSGNDPDVLLPNDPVPALLGVTTGIRIDDPMLAGTTAVADVSEADASIVNDDRRLQAGMHLRLLVIVADRPEIDIEETAISEDGALLLPLVKEVDVSDLTLREAADQLTVLYGKYFRGPEVYLRVVPRHDGNTAAARGYVTVTGRVKQPGLVPIPDTMDLTVSQAVLKSGGLNTSAKERSVRVTRRAPDGTVERFQVDLRAVLAEGKLEKDLVLRAGDVIYVPESLF